MAGLLALTALFLPWTQLSATDPEVRAALAALPPGDVSRSVWASTFFAWFPPLVLSAAGVCVVVFGQRPTLRASGLPQLWLVATVVALTVTVLGWVFLDAQFGADQRALFAAGGIRVGAGIGRYLGTLAAVASFGIAALDVRAVRTRSQGGRSARRERSRR